MNAHKACTVECLSQSNPLIGEVGELQHRSRQQVPPLMQVETCEQMGLLVAYFTPRASLSKRFVCKPFSSPTLQG